MSEATDEYIYQFSIKTTQTAIIIFPSWLILVSIEEIFRAIFWSINEQTTFPLLFLLVFISSHEEDGNSRAFTIASFRQKMLASCSGEFSRVSMGVNNFSRNVLPPFLHDSKKRLLSIISVPTLMFIEILSNSRK